MGRTPRLNRRYGGPSEPTLSRHSVSCEGYPIFCTFLLQILADTGNHNSSDDKCVKVFTWTGELLGIVFTDYGWYKVKHPWVFGYDSKPYNDRMKVEVSQ